MAEKVLESAPNATTSDDRGRSVRIPLAKERCKRERERKREESVHVYVRNRTRATSEPPLRGTDERDPTR